MAVVLDTNIVIAAMRARDQRHEEVRAWLAQVDDDLVTTPLALAEMDYIVERLFGRQGVHGLWADFESGAYQVRWWADATDESIAVARGAGALNIGLTDASLVALASRLNTTRIATLDVKHFRQLTAPSGEPFVVLPADAPQA